MSDLDFECSHFSECACSPECPCYYDCYYCIHCEYCTGFNGSCPKYHNND